METQNYTPCAFITGGSHGIGAGVVKVLAREGYDVAFTYNSRAAEAEQLAEAVRAETGRRCFYYQASLQERDVPVAVTERAITDLGRLDVLVCNAGVTRHNLLTLTDADFIDGVYNPNFRSYVLCAGAAARHMRDNGIRGSIVFISSTRGLRAYATDAIYGGLKAAVNRACESFALELSQYGIRCNVIAPGGTATQGDPDDPNFTNYAFAKKVPLGRLGHPYEIGHAIAFLSSEKAAYITGVTLKIDGGLVLPGMPEDGREENGWNYGLDRFSAYLTERYEAKQQEKAAQNQ